MIAYASAEIGMLFCTLDIITGYLRHLRSLAEQAGGQPLTQVVMGRPVFFVDDDPERDAAAQASLEAAARAVGFTDVAFQFEPIAAAFDYEQHAHKLMTWDGMAYVA